MGLWESLIEHFSLPENPFSAIALTDGGVLYQEGQEMHHCVSSYAEKCKEEGARIFSIRDNENQSVATLELNPQENGRYIQGQLRGKCNARIMDENILHLCDRLTKEMNRVVIEEKVGLAKKNGCKW